MRKEKYTFPIAFGCLLLCAAFFALKPSREHVVVIYNPSAGISIADDGSSILEAQHTKSTVDNTHTNIRVVGNRNVEHAVQPAVQPAGGLSVNAAAQIIRPATNSQNVNTNNNNDTSKKKILTPLPINSIYNLKVKDIDNNLVDFQKYQNKITLIINVASK